VKSRNLLPGNISGQKRKDPAVPGFTLVEILLAILILGIVLSTIYAAYTGTLRVVKATEEDDALYGMARGFFVRITKDFGGMAPYREGYEFSAKPYEIKGQSFLRVSFRSSAHLAFSEHDLAAGVAQISYETIEDQEAGGYRLLRLDSLFEEAQGSAAATAATTAATTTATTATAMTTTSREELMKKSFVLCNNIHSLVYKFYDAEGKEYETWDSGSDNEAQKKRAPAMIMVQLNLLNPGNKDQPLRYMTRIMIPINKVDRAGASS
jgi:prepilin-type N-terminal cleavage/methylation domain-containing protein